MISTSEQSHIQLDDIIRRLEELWGIPNNDAGIWNCPADTTCFTLDLKEIVNHSGYYRGDHKFIYHTYLNPLCDAKWKPITLPKEPAEFLKLCASGYDPAYPQSSKLITVSLTQALEYLVTIGDLTREECWIEYTW